MTKSVDTAFERHFSEPPVVAVKEGRTHCEACKEPLDPNVMHKCHGNQPYEPGPSHTEITEKCPDCDAVALLGEIERIANAKRFVVVCPACRTFVHPETLTAADAIFGWNSAVAKQRNEMILAEWPKWLADLPGADERLTAFIRPGANPADVQIRHPDLTNYQGACPALHVEGKKCDLCENTGTIPPAKEDAE